MTEDELITEVTALLKSHGYRKTNLVWRKSLGTETAVIQLQRSQFGLGVYLNVGIYIGQFGDRKNPLIYECHIEQRLDALSYDLLADCKCDIDTRTNEGKFELLRAHVLPLTNACGTSGWGERMRVLMEADLAQPSWITTVQLSEWLSTRG